MRSGKSFVAHLTGMCAALEHDDTLAVNQAVQRWLNGPRAIVKPAEPPRDRGGLTIVYLYEALTPKNISDVWRNGRAQPGGHGPGLLGAPPHWHTREDELSYVLEGTLTVWREGAVTAAAPGAVIQKPRGEWHTFWNAGPVPVRFLEINRAAGLCRLFP